MASYVSNFFILCFNEEEENKNGNTIKHQFDPCILNNSEKQNETKMEKIATSVVIENRSSHYLCCYFSFRA